MDYELRACRYYRNQLGIEEKQINRKISCTNNINFTKNNMAQSIYNIIPKQYNPPAKEKLYKSKYPPTIPPTGSTFGNTTTSKPGVSNLGGELQVGLQAHTQYGNTKTLGHLKGDRKPSPDKFLKKNTGTMGNQTLPEPNKFSYDCSHKKDPVPTSTQRPVHGMKSGKNFIVTNAIQNILSTAKQMPQSANYLKKKDYGQVPEYLQKVKQNITTEYKMIQNLHQQYNQQKKCLSQEEVNAIREGLKRKWNEVNFEYQKLTHVRIVDTIGLKGRKEKYEKELGEIEADIKKLNKLYVFIDE